MTTPETFDTIIVGAGSAGCVLAARLTEAGQRVLLLEAGGSDRRFWVQVPIGYAKTFNDACVNWRYETEPVPSLADVTVAETAPGADVTSDDALDAYIREQAWTVYHPCGTCRMGTDEATSVVDPSLRVHGVEGLRVVDASAFPNVTSGNINAPTIMLAERASDLISAEA